MNLRLARRTDARAIRDLIHLTGINPLGLDWRRFVVIVDEHDRLLACGQIKPHSDGSRELASLAVQPHARGQGLARLILEHLIASQPPPLYLTCASHLQPLYEKFGFRILSLDEMPPYFKRLSRLVNNIARLIRLDRHMLVMLRSGTPGQFSNLP